jgi:hypothetical protein
MKLKRGFLISLVHFNNLLDKPEERSEVAMGLEQTVKFPDTVPPWRDVRELLTRRGFPIQVRMIDGELAFPDEIPAEPWRELRVSSDAGMVTVRREQNRVALITWGNIDAPLLRLRNALAWAFAEVGNGRTQTDQGDLAAIDFLRSADLPPELRG